MDHLPIRVIMRSRRTMTGLSLARTHVLALLGDLHRGMQAVGVIWYRRRIGELPL